MSDILQRTRYAPITERPVDKGAVASVPAADVKNHLYPSPMTTRVLSTESFSTAGSSSFSALNNFGGSYTVDIATQTFVGKTYLRMVLPTVPENVYLPEGWGFMAVQGIKYDLGGVESPEIPREQYFQKVMLEAQTDEVRRAIIRMAGEEVIAQQEAGTNEAIIPILMPFSSVNGLNQPIPFDSKTGGRRMRLTIRYAPLNYFASGSGLSTWDVKQFTSADIYIRETRITSRSYRSDMSELINQRHMTMSYPNQRMNSYPYSFTATAGVPVSISLNGIQKADLTTICFMLVRGNRLSASTAGTEPVNMLDIAGVREVLLERGGIRYLYSPANSRLDQGYAMSDELGSFTYIVNVRDASGGVEPFFTHPEAKRLILYNAGVTRATKDVSTMASVPSAEENNFNLTITPTVSGECTLYTLYMYNEAVVVSGNSAALML